MIECNNSELIKDLKIIVGDVIFKIFIEDGSGNVLILGSCLTEVVSGIKKNILLTITPAAISAYNSEKHKKELENFITVYKRRFNLSNPSKISLDSLETIDFGIIVPQIFS